MTAKHTKGPWITETRRDGNIEVGPRDTTTDGDVLPLALVYGDDSDPVCWPVSANAKLIAAAPELADDAEKLTALLAHIIEYAHYASDDDLPADILNRIEDEANAVAKAVGYDGTTCAALRRAGRLP